MTTNAKLARWYAALSPSSTFRSSTLQTEQMEHVDALSQGFGQCNQRVFALSTPDRLAKEQKERQVLPKGGRPFGQRKDEAFVRQ
jgi:hypothetical protein